MSAFIVQADTINRIANLFDKAQFDNQAPLCYVRRVIKMRDFGRIDLLQAFVNELHGMNIGAMIARYGNRNEFDETQTRYKSMPIDNKDLWQVLKSLDCYLYQCSEGDIPESPLFKEVEAAREALADWLLRNTTEYNAATWG